MYEYSSAVAKLRGLELIAEGAADRRAASLRRTRRKRDRHATKGPAAPMGSTGARPAMAK
jgi:inactivated superfamily I helicase